MTSNATQINFANVLLDFRSKAFTTTQVSTGRNIVKVAANTTAPYTFSGNDRRFGIVYPIKSKNIFLPFDQRVKSPLDKSEDDVGVVILDPQQTATMLALWPNLATQMLPKLPAIDFNKTLIGKEPLLSVGFGVTDIVQKPNKGGAAVPDDYGMRRMAYETFNNISSDSLHASENYAQGNGGSCYGDSGSGLYKEIKDSAGNVIDLIQVSVISTGDNVCRASDVSYRLDLAQKDLNSNMKVSGEFVKCAVAVANQIFTADNAATYDTLYVALHNQCGAKNIP
jgi:hypothetical protein